MTIINALGFEVEKGMATEMQSSGSGEWIYKTKETNHYYRGGRIDIRVTDSPLKTRILAGSMVSMEGI